MNRPAVDTPAEVPVGERRCIEVTSRNIWFLERSIPLFNLLEFFPAAAVGGPETGGSQRKGRLLTLHTDQGWSLRTDITADSRVFRNRSRSRGTGLWVLQAGLEPGDRVVIEKLDEFEYKIYKETAAGQTDRRPAC